MLSEGDKDGRPCFMCKRTEAEEGKCLVGSHKAATWGAGHRQESLPVNAGLLLPPLTDHSPRGNTRLTFSFQPPGTQRDPPQEKPESLPKQSPSLKFRRSMKLIRGDAFFIIIYKLNNI